MTQTNNTSPAERCACPFCHSMRPHAPPGCHCSVCGDRGKPPNHPVSVRVAEIPEPHKDVAELLESDGGPEKYEAMIRDARMGPSWMIAHLDDVQGHDVTSVTGKVAAARDMVDVLLGQPPIAREQYVAELAAKLGCSDAAVRETLDDALGLRRAHYQRHPNEAPWRQSDPDGEIGMDIPQ